MYPLIIRLMNEHRQIEAVLDALTAHAALEAPAREATAEFADFFVTYADHIHHAKEEDGLFRALEGAGFQRQMGPLAVMLSEHEMGRAAVRALAELGKGAGFLAGNELIGLRTTSGNFSDLLKGHIMKEDRVLYPMSMQVLDPNTFLKLDEELLTRENEKFGAATIEKYERLAKDLAARFPTAGGVALPVAQAADAVSPHSGCGGGCGGHG